MGMKQNAGDIQLGDDYYELDEGWWSSILADEDAGIPSRPEQPQKNSSQPAAVVNWDKVKQCFEQDEVVELEVYGYNRGGLLVQCENIQGFVPVSHLVDFASNNYQTEEERTRILASYVGRKLLLKVIECEPGQERVVLSERAALAGEGRRRQLFKALKIGEIVDGVVTNITDFGIFVDLGGVEGLIHVSELSWGRVQNPEDVLSVGAPVKTVVLQVAEESARVALSLKRLTPNPWEQLTRRYKPGDVVTARITAIMRFGAFARLDEGVEGLVHISSIEFPAGIRKIEQYLHVGQVVQVRILHIEAERRRLGLGLVSVA